ncbi:MAG TPA: TlpA disulfide reductase family protein [Bryobacteraceae bacterium]|jgi:peroxiredoxin|nr:TlpA disulfide reductase family protein [Bryobacteraceae bacterium]
MKTALLLLLAGLAAGAAEQKTVRAPLVSPANRRSAPGFHLTNAAGKAVDISAFRGKVMLLDFWATECGGCKVEIPWFMEMAAAWKGQPVAVVGVSMDVLYENLKDASEGWGKVKPFVREHGVNYPILMGDDAVTKSYDIQALPATYLIDRKGRIAATYVGVVNREDVEANIKALLGER